MGRPSGGAFVGLDIGTQTIKVVELRGMGNRVQVTGMGIENTPPGLVQQGIVVDPKALGAVIKSLLSRSGVSARRVVSAANGTAAVVVRVIDVPKMTATELADTMKWEVERHIPFSANDVEMSYQAIDDGPVTDANDPNMRVLLAVAQRDMLTGHLATLQAAGLNPVAIDVEPLAVGRSLVNLSPNGLATKNIVIVNMGASNTEVGVFKNGVLRFPRSIPLAGDNLTNAIAMNLGIPMEQAEEEKRQHAMVFMDLIGPGASANPFDAGEPAPAASTPFDIPMNTPFAEMTPGVPPPLTIETPPTNPFGEPLPPVASTTPFDPDNPFGSPPPNNPFEEVIAAPAVVATPAVQDDPVTRRRREIFDAMLPILGEFSMELRRSMDYFRSTYPNDAVDQILLCGGSSVIPNLDKFIESDLGVPTSVANPFSGVSVASKQMSPERAAELAPAFAVAVGLAARDAVLGAGD